MERLGRVHVLDPEGDVELIYQRSPRPFAVWPEDGGAPKPNIFAKSAVSAKKKRKYDKAFGGDSFLLSSVDPGALNQPPPQHRPFESAANGARVPERQEQPDNDDKDEPEDSIRIKASSKHLKLASTYFVQNLGPHHKKHESTIRSDTDAMLTIMNILHGRSQRVPRQVTLEKLAKMAWIVYDYKCHDAVNVFAEIWIFSLKDTLPNEYGRNLVLWLFISCIFSQEEVYKQMTKVAIMSSNGPIQTLELPIPQRVVDDIEEKRMGVVEQIIARLNGVAMHLDDFREKCSPECSLVLLGALTKQLQANGLYNPTPAQPFLGLSFTGITTIAHSFVSPNWNTISIKPYGDDVELMHDCELGPFIDAAIKSVEDGIEGLELFD